jgi:ribosomal-protein-alanine N-acetyltransferase
MRKLQNVLFLIKKLYHCNFFRLVIKKLASSEKRMFIKKACIKDLGDLDKINRKCLPENYEIDQWRMLLNNFSDYSFIALLDNKIVGYCLLVDQNGKGIIPSIAVLEEYRKQGIGKKLLITSIVAYKKVEINSMKTIFLHCRESNKAAINLYNTLKFEKVGKIKDYYSNPIEDAYELQRP